MAKQMTKFEHNPGMVMFLTYLALLASNLVVLYLGRMWFAQHIVLGTGHITMAWAMWHSMGKLALIGLFAIPFVREWEHRRGKILSSMEWMVAYFVINFLGLWALTRYSEVFGLGVTSWVVIAVLALAMDFVQGMAMMKLEKWRTS